MRTGRSNALWFAVRYFGAFIGTVVVLRLLTVDVGLSELLAIGVTLLVAEVLRVVVRKRRRADPATDTDRRFPAAQ